MKIPQDVRTLRFIFIPVFIFAIALSLVACEPEEQESTAHSTLQPSATANSLTTGPTSKTSTTKSATTTSHIAGELLPVTNVVDGDTIKVRIDGNIETIRFIGIDTPETRDPRKPVQCFGKEATNKMKNFVENKQVILEMDPTQGDRDRYGRLLRFVFLPDGTNVNFEMINQGFAFEYTYNVPYKYQNEFKSAQRFARENDRGLWSPSTCNGETDQAAGSGQSAGSSASSEAGAVKKSNSGICHGPGTTYYHQTKNFTPYSSIEECLASGGRLPKR